MHLVAASLNHRIDGLEAKMDSGFESQTLKLVAEIAKLEAKFEARLMGEISRLETKMSDGKTEMIRWMFVFWVGQIAAMVALIKLLK